MPGLDSLQFGNYANLLKDSPTMGPLFAMWADQEKDQQAKQQAQALESNNLKNIQEAIATRQAQALDNPADIDVLRRGKLGQALSQDATGRYDQGVLPGRIATANAENKTKLSAAQLQDMVHQLDIAASALDTPSPLGVNVIENEGLRNKVIKEMQRSGRSPKEIVQAMANSVKSAISNSPKFMADANIKAIEGANKMNEQALQNQGAMARTVYSEDKQDARQDKEISAGKYANKGKTVALSSIQQLIKTGRYEAAATGLHLMATMEEDQEKAQLYEREAARFEQMEKDKQLAKGAGKPDVGGMGVPVVKPPPSRINPSTATQGNRPPLESFNRKK